MSHKTPSQHVQNASTAAPTAHAEGHDGAACRPSGPEASAGPGRQPHRGDSDAPIVVWTTAPDHTAAARIARALVEARLAACVHCLPVGQSVYRWRGTIETADETVLMIKSTQSQRAGLECRLRELHPYEVPELLVTSVGYASPDYLQWLIECTR